MTPSTELDRRFRAAAARSGLLDAAYDVLASPLGPLLVATTPAGLLRISFEPEPEPELERIAGQAGRRVLRAPQRVAHVLRQLEEYFEGSRRTFELELDLRGATPFTATVLAELARVPFGETATYGALAARAGRPAAARAVGGVMNRNPIPIVLPCHRVVGSDGSLTGYAGGLARKETLLRLEGLVL